MGKITDALGDLFSEGVQIDESKPTKINPIRRRSTSSARTTKQLADTERILSHPASEFRLYSQSTTLVPNDFPTLSQPYRIAVIGEAPSRDDEIAGRPFVGISGQTLTNLLSRAGVLRAACFLGNISQRRPPNNDIELADQSDIDEGCEQLAKDLDEYQPNICLLLGNTAFHKAKQTGSIGDWRGSYFISELAGPFFGRKCIASFHPAACLRNYEWIPLLLFDIKRALLQGTTGNLQLPQRHLQINLTANEITERLQRLLQSPQPISIDIEGGVRSMSCISIATSPSESFIIPFTHLDGSSYWTSLEDECAVWELLALVLADPRITKILQNALYDRFVLQYSYALVVCSNREDTMLKSWEIYCELEKSLGFLCSIYTDEPFYKQDRKSQDLETFFRYCCRDSAVTYEISNKIQPMLGSGSLQHYQFNIALLDAMLYMELRGISYDTTLAKRKLSEVETFIFRLQAELDTIASAGITSCGEQANTRVGIMSLVQGVMCFVRDSSKPKKGYESIYPRVLTILGKPEFSKEDLGFLSIACGWSMNIKSPKFKTFLYDTLNLPKQYSKADDSGTKHLTTDNNALLKIQKKQPHLAVELAIQISELRTRYQMLHIFADDDGRVRASYNVVGADTGRVSCSTSPTGSGYNLTTIPDDYEIFPPDYPLRYGMRQLFRADLGYHMFQCDLKGSDGWTIGANLAALGDNNMLEDLRCGIKPANRICYMLRHGNGSLLRKSREEIKELLKEIKKSDWDYFACKVGIWGVCYLMGPDLLGDQIMEESYGKFTLSRKEVEDFRNAVMAGYNVRLWHNAMAAKLAKSPYLTVPSGHRRRFFARTKDALGQALAHEPQANTTYATNKAALRLWQDQENRTRTPDRVSQGCSLRIEPLHQVHDALIGQFKIKDTSWAVNKIKSYFDNTIVIAGIPIVIPFEGNYGKNWGDLSEGTI